MQSLIWWLQNDLKPPLISRNHAFTVTSTQLPPPLACCIQLISLEAAAKHMAGAKLPSRVPMNERQVIAAVGLLPDCPERPTLRTYLVSALTAFVKALILSAATSSSAIAASLSS